MTKRSIAIFILILGLFFMRNAMASEDWPAESWTESTVLTWLDSDFATNLSGAHWNDTTETLWVCLNGPGKFWAIVEDENGGFQVDTKDGRRGEFNIPGDIEGITQVDLEDPSVYVIVEGQDLIRRYDISTYGQAVLVDEYNISAHMPTSGGSGSEGIAFVTDEFLSLNGFVDENGAPYVSQNGMGGLMFVAHQNGGRIYVFDLVPDSGDFDFVGSYKTSRAESSGLEFDRSSGNLYIWHNTGPNYVEVTDLTSFVGTGGARYFNTLKEYYGPRSGNLEGVAITSATAEDLMLFITDDDNQDGAALTMYQDFSPQLLGSEYYEIYSDTTLSVSAPGLMNNDIGVDELTLVQGPQHGWLEGLSEGETFEGSFSYRPFEGYSGPDEFTYSAAGLEQIARVKILINPIRTFVGSVSSGNDDVEERADGSMYMNSSDLELIRDKGDQTVGIRFTSIDIPEGSTIIDAHIQFAVDEVSDETTNLTIHGDASADAVSFSTSPFDVSHRTRTSSNVQWSPQPWNTQNEVSDLQKTPDLSIIVQEILNDQEWHSGNAMAFVVTGSGRRTAMSRNKSAALAPKLVVRYSEPGGGQGETVISRVTSRISSSVDDVEERANGSIYTNSSDLELIHDRNDQTVGMRFVGLDIPRDSRVTNAYIQFTTDEVSSEEANLTIKAEASGDASAFSSAAHNVSGRKPTSSAVVWTPAPWTAVGEAGELQRTPDLSEIVQEIVDGSGWSRGNSMAFTVMGSGRRVAMSFDKSSSRAPQLVVEYEQPEGDIEPLTGSLDLRIMSSADDAEERADGSMYINSSDLELIHDKDDQIVGMRFAGVNIPDGTSVVNAYLQFAVDEVSDTATTLSIRGEAAANPSVFSVDHANISGRKTTAAAISYSPEAWMIVGEASEGQRTSDIGDIVRELMAVPGWTSGNAMVFIVTGSGRRVAESFDGSPSTAPLLHIEYQ